MKAKLGIAPIAWWNDDLPEISGDVTLEELLSQARQAGFSGIETGRRFPMDAAILRPILESHDMKICGGWFSGLLLDGDIEREKDRISAQMALFKEMNAPCIVYGETSGTIQGDRAAPLSTRRHLGEEDIREYGRKMTIFGEWCAEQGMPICYHHHMAAPIESENDIDLLMNHSGESLSLLYDSGHLAFAGADVMRVIDKHHSRISHVHTKDIRRSVIDALDRTRASFLDAVLIGAFTAPGDGSLNFRGIAERFARYGYEGWFVVEAEQDPVEAPPAKYARVGYEALIDSLVAAGYLVET